MQATTTQQVGPVARLRREPSAVRRPLSPTVTFIVLVALLVLPVAARSSQQEKRLFEVSDIFELKNVGDPRISPDGEWVAFTVSQMNADEDSSVALERLTQRTRSGLRFFQTRLQLVFFKSCLLVDIGLGRHGAHFATFHSQPSQKQPHLGQTASDAGDFCDPFLGLSHRMGRPYTKLVFQRVAIVIPGRVRLFVVEPF